MTQNMSFKGFSHQTPPQCIILKAVITQLDDEMHTTIKKKQLLT